MSLMWIGVLDGGLSPFQFLIVVEGLIGLVHNAYSSRDFHRFHFNDDIHFEILQFTDDVSIECTT